MFKAKTFAKGVSFSDLFTVVLGLGLGVGAVSTVWWLISHAPQSVNVYWLSAQGDLVAEQRSLWIPNDESTLESSLRTLLSGSPQEEWFSTIPAGAVLLGLRIEGGDIFVNLSPAFSADSEGLHRRHALARLQQVIFTATQEFYDGRVWLSIEGQALEHLGDLPIPQPLTRAVLLDLAAALPMPPTAPTAPGAPISAPATGIPTD